MNIYFLSQNLASFITILYPKLFNIFEDIQIKKSQRAKHKKTAMVWWVDSSWAKAAIKRPEKLKKHKELLKQHFFYFKRTRITAGNQDKYLSSSEALISVELEVDDALYLEHSRDNEHVGGRTSGRKTKTV